MQYCDDLECENELPCTIHTQESGDKNEAEDSASEYSTEEEEENKGGEDWQEWDEEAETAAALCLFCKHTAPTATIWTHMKEQHNFDFYGLKTKQGSAVAATIKAVNDQKKWLTSEEYLKPVIEDDPLLFELDDDNDSESDDEYEQKQKTSKAKKPPADPMAALEKTNKILRSQVQEAGTRIQQMQRSMQRFIEDADDKTLGPETPAINPHDEGYFENYSARNIHEIMLKDRTRTLAYRDFMLQNKSLFEGKVVLDVGCGTGILCMFAAQAGAKQVIGVDAADIIDKARIIVRENKWDHIVTFVKSKIEEAVLPVEKVDIIVSEWMGYFLLFESMLPSVLYARDKWLVEGGLVLPNQATMFIAAGRVAKKETVESFWKDVYGFDMRALVDPREYEVSCDVDDVAATKICSKSEVIKDIDILSCHAKDLEFTTPFELQASQESLLDSFVVWFDVMFHHGNAKAVTLTTGPTSTTTPLTHWFQTVFYLHEHLTLKSGDVVTGTIKAFRDKQCDRSYKVQLTYGLKGGSTYIQDFTV